jgi:hypothetical protein
MNRITFRNSSRHHFKVIRKSSLPGKYIVLAIPGKLTPPQTPNIIRFFLALLRSLGSSFTIGRNEILDRIESRKD